MAAEPQDIPPSVRRVLYQAQTLMAEKRLAEARRKLEAYSVGRKSSHHMIAFTLGDIRMLAKQYPQAAAAYRKALDLSPSFAPAWMNLGKAAYEMADYPKAADCFHRAYRTAAEPHPERLYYSAAAWLMAAKPRQGLKMFDDLLARHPAAVELEWKPTLVQLYLSLGRPLDALPVIEELAAQSTPPERFRWQETLIGHYLLLGRTDQALAFTRELTRDDPTVPRWWQAQAHLLLERKDYKAALEALVIYAKLITPSPSEKRLLADLNLQVGIPSVAANYYRELVVESPDADTLKRLVHTLRLLDAQSEALQHIERYLSKQADPGLLWIKGELLYQMKNYLAAAETFRRCVQEPSRAGQAWLMAGYASWQAKDFSAATAEFTRATRYPDQKKNALIALEAMKPLSASDGS